MEKIRTSAAFDPGSGIGEVDGRFDLTFFDELVEWPPAEQATANLLCSYFEGEPFCNGDTDPILVDCLERLALGGVQLIREHSNYGVGGVGFQRVKMQ